MNNSPDASMKQCSTCKQSFPATFEFFFKDNSRKDGFTGRCKGCMNKYQQEHKDHILEYKKQYYATNKAALIAQAQQYRQEHIEQYRESSRRYYLLYGERLREKCKQYQETAKGRLVAKAHQHRRRIIRQQTSKPLNAQNIADQFKRQRNHCYYCGIKLGVGRRDYHIDHIIPLSRGGEHSADNVVIACPTCNLKKHSKLLSEWPEGGRLF